MYIVISDTHIGHPSCVLKNITGLKRLTNTIEAETYGQVYTLVLLGDVIDFCYVNYQEGIEELKDFLQVVIEETSVKKIVWVIGNHDYHYLARLMDDIGVDKFSDESYTVKFKINDDLTTSIEVVYPEYFIWNDSKTKCIVLSHGHLLGPDGSLFSIILGDPKQSVSDVCSMNHSWLDFSWYGIWIDKRIGNEMWTGSSALAAFMVETMRGKSILQMAKYINQWLVYTRKITPAVTKFIFGHTHQAGDDVIRLYNSEKLNNHNIRVINLGSWIIEKRLRKNPNEFLPPDTLIARINNGQVKITRVKYKSDYLKRIGNQGNIIHSAEWGLWVTRPGP